MKYQSSKKFQKLILGWVFQKWELSKIAKISYAKATKVKEKKSKIDQEKPKETTKDEPYSKKKKTMKILK